MARIAPAVSSSAEARQTYPLSGIGRFFSAFWQEMTRDAVRPYRPELHYMRGPGPAWRAKHGSQISTDPSIFSIHQP